MSDIDPLDRQIVEQLSHNGRMSNLEVGRLLGVSEKTVRARIRRLMERDGMRIEAVFDQAPAQSRLIVMLHSAPGQRFAVAARLAGIPSVWHVRDRIAPDNPWGIRMEVPEHLYDRGEIHNLSIERGTLTAEERFKINQHVIDTIRGDAT